LGAPAGGRSGSIAGNDASGSLASYGSVPSNGLSGIGNTSRRGPSDSAWLTKFLSTLVRHATLPHRIASGHHPIRVGSSDWLAREVLKGVGDLVVLEPDEAREAVLKAAGTG
jgi:hypothetical protein